ncbi:hypothetical protein GGR54DRAFT_282630 [Hypoxylon sp. NC1633]|nr:hypothetical protein GGR54DRAFT_282630 [Hypoxylon sp. NC1633]
MYFDSELNSAKTMLSNVYNAFLETATKMWAYARCLSAQKQPSPNLVKSESGRTLMINHTHAVLLDQELICVDRIDFEIGRHGVPPSDKQGSQTPVPRLHLRHQEVRGGMVGWTSRPFNFGHLLTDSSRLAYNAFRRVLERKQAKYGTTLGWLKAEIKKLGMHKDIRQGRVTQLTCIQP